MISKQESILAETLIIKRDFTALSNIVVNFERSLITSLLPFVALLCKEVIEYLDTMGVSVDFPKTSKYSVSDIRSKTKFFDISTNKLIETTRFVDELQNSYFRDLLRFAFMKRLNLHYNLGVYYCDDKIMGNTHFAFYILQNDKDLLKKFSDREKYEILSEQVKSLGFDLGNIIGVINRSIAIAYHKKGIADPLAESVFMEKNIKTTYKDYNTNRIKEIGVSSTRAINLFLLHILSNANFVSTGLANSVQDDTGLLMRIQYIVLHYICFRIKKLTEFVKQNPNIICEKSQLDMINALASSVTEIEDNNLKSSTFRNCLMHLRLCDEQGNSFIKTEYYDISKPYCGLIESLFDGSSYEKIKNGIVLSLIRITKILEPHFKYLKPFHGK